MIAILRGAVAVIAGLVVALILVIAVEAFSEVVHPRPPDFQNTMEETCAHVERYPVWVLAVVIPMWAGIAFASRWLAGRLRNRISALFVGILLFGAAAFNVSMPPYPKVVQDADFARDPLRDLAERSFIDPSNKPGRGSDRYASRVTIALHPQICQPSRWASPRRGSTHPTPRAGQT